MSQIRRNVVFQQVLLAVCYMTLVIVFHSFSRHLGTYLPGVHSFSKCRLSVCSAHGPGWGSSSAGRLSVRRAHAGGWGAACTAAAQARTRPVPRAHSPAQWGTQATGVLTWGCEDGAVWADGANTCPLPPQHGQGQP